MTKRIVLAVLAALALAGAANAQITISGGFALSAAELSDDQYEGEIGMGGNIYLDYLLPIGVPLSLGAEVGYDTSRFPYDGGEDIAIAIPLLLRAAYHFDLMPRLDLYLVGKIGYVFGDVTGDSVDLAKENNIDIEVAGGLGFGIDAGVAFYFTPLVGIFAEAGFDQYKGKYTVKYMAGEESTNITFSRFLTAGLSIKF
jgi:opacity protein-like surface antigen